MEQPPAASLFPTRQDFVGSNNLNLLIPSGQFGTRAQGGKARTAMRFTIVTVTILLEKKNEKRKTQQSLQSASLVALQDAASARYIYTRPVTVLSCFIVWKSFQDFLEWRISVRLAPIARMLFSSLDDPVLEYQALGTVCHHLAMMMPLLVLSSFFVQISACSRRKRVRRLSRIGTILSECSDADTWANRVVRHG